MTLGRSTIAALAAVLVAEGAGPPARAEASVPGPGAPAAAPVFPLQRVVPVGEARTIAFYASLFPDCSSQGPVVIRLLAPPRHGTVSFEDADSFTRYASGTPLAACNARKVPGKRMTYEAAEGFEGTDGFRIFVINADGTGYESEVTVSVR